MSERRDVLAEGATDYVLEHGLIGLSLRPLGAALGTSDRMLLYHFAGRDDLVATVLRLSNERSVRTIRALPASAGLREAVLDLWHTFSTPELARCQRLYVEACALGVLGTEPYASLMVEANDVWLSALGDHLVASGMSRASAPRAARFVEATFMGLQLDEPIESEERIGASVGDLADAVARRWGA